MSKQESKPSRQAPEALDQQTDQAFSEFDETSGGESIERLRQENAGLQAEVRAQGDRVLRAEAELENTRKRLRRDFEDQVRYATLPLAKDMLSVLDNLERALAAAQGNEGGLAEGVKMVAEQLRATLAQHHCRAMEAAPGGQFDPHRHEAIGQEPSEFPAGSISRVVRTGYQMHDRVVRAAQVLLSAGKPA
jgi:molecular chaperone GrpE